MVLMRADEGDVIRIVRDQPRNPLRLLLVDDHLMVTEALASRLSAAPDMWVAGRCSTTDPSLLDIVGGMRPDLITIEVEPLGRICTVMPAELLWHPDSRRMPPQTNRNAASDFRNLIQPPKSW